MNEASPAAVDRRALWLVAFMWIAYFLNYCDRQVVFALFRVFESDLGFNETGKGLVGSFFLWVYAVGCPIAGILGDRYSKRLLVVLSLAVWSLVTIVTGFATSSGMLLALRAAMGISEALYMPAAIALTAAAFSSTARSRALAALTTAQICGTVAGGWFGGWMADLGRWRDAFYLLGAVGVIYAVPYALFLRRVPESHRPSNAASPPPKFAAGTLARTPTFVLLCVAFPLFVFGLWLVYAWLPDFLGSKFRLNNEDAAFNAVAFQQGATLVGILSGGVLADRLYHRTKAARMWLLAVSFLGCAPALVGIGYAESLNSTRIAVVVYGLMSGLFMGNIFPTAYDVVPAATRATVVGALNLFGSLIAGFGPLFGGLAKKTIGIDALLALTGGIYLVGAVLVVGGVYTVFHRDHARIERL